jgi:cytochrome P450
MELPRWFLRSDYQWLFPFRSLKTLDREIRRVLQERRTSPSPPEFHDILSVLLAAVHDDGLPMTDSEIRDELVTLLIAGTESTTVAIEWAVRDILTHPAVHERAAEEIHAATNGESITPEVLADLKYLEAVITESLRLHPVLPWVARKLTADFQVRGTAFAKGTVLAPSIYLVHQRKDLYPDPGQFRPERFLSKKPDPFTWFPFGGSNRRCIGMTLALTEMKVILATILQCFQMKLLRPSGRVKPVRRGLLWAPSDGTRVVLEPAKRIRRATPVG